MSSCGSSFRKSRSASGVQHSGQVMLEAPVAKRASACLRTHCAQYQPCEQPKRTARQGGTSLQQMPQSSSLLFRRMPRGLEPGDGGALLPPDRGAGLNILASPSAESAAFGRVMEHGVAGGRMQANSAASASVKKRFGEVPSASAGSPPSASASATSASAPSSSAAGPSSASASSSSPLASSSASSSPVSPSSPPSSASSS
mmetsp:Transcript_62817/g.162336  ORF Transcript_62817/g.162336 Transcript_62817/m.162336 type:complete len:201 (-) Transcript_62817:435-1037(-)